MKLPLDPLTLLLAITAHACMEFKGIFPFSTSLPYEASITDNGVITCWISTTYAAHTDLQEAHARAHSHSHHGRTHKKRSVGRKISLSVFPPDEKPSAYFASPYMSQARVSDDEKHVDLHAVPPVRSGLAEGRKTRRYEADEWEALGKGRPAWEPWPFECLAGYRARANVGLGSVAYEVHGQEFVFVPGVREDVGGERWLYGHRLWCADEKWEKKGKGSLVENQRPMGENKGVSQRVKGGEMRKGSREVGKSSDGGSHTESSVATSHDGKGIIVQGGDSTQKGLS